MPPSEQPDRIRLRTTAWPMLCSLRSPSPSTWDWVNSSTTTLTSEMRPGNPHKMLTLVAPRWLGATATTPTC